MILEKFDTVHPVFRNHTLQEKLHELEEEFTVKIIHDQDVQRVLQDSLNCCKLELCVYGLCDEARDRGEIYS